MGKDLTGGGESSPETLLIAFQVAFHSRKSSSREYLRSGFMAIVSVNSRRKVGTKEELLD